MNTKSIKQKMKSVGNIKKITRTMEMVSVAKMKKSSEAAHAYRPFIDNARQTLETLYTDQSIKHPLLYRKDINLNNKKDSTGHEVKKEKSLIILIAANKGLCGGYNTQVYKAMQRFVADHNVSAVSGPDISVISIGKYAERIAKRFTPDIIYSYLKNNISNRDASIIVKEVIKRYLDKENVIDNVTLIYPHIYSGISYKVETRQLLPYIETENISLNKNNTNNDSLSNNSTIKNNVVVHKENNYEPDVETIVSAIVPLLLEAMILSATLETAAGEHAARMMAMKTASDNAGDMLHDLKLNYNNARQAKITQEIAELSSVA